MVSALPKGIEPVNPELRESTYPNVELFTEVSDLAQGVAANHSGGLAYISADHIDDALWRLAPEGRAFADPTSIVFRAVHETELSVFGNTLGVSGRLENSIGLAYDIHANVAIGGGRFSIRENPELLRRFSEQRKGNLPAPGNMGIQVLRAAQHYNPPLTPSTIQQVSVHELQHVIDHGNPYIVNKDRMAVEAIGNILSYFDNAKIAMPSIVALSGYLSLRRIGISKKTAAGISGTASLTEILVADQVNELLTFAAYRLSPMERRARKTKRLAPQIGQIITIR